MKSAMLFLAAALLLPAFGFSKDSTQKNRKPSSIECPAAGQEGSLEKTVAMVKAAGSCYEGAKIAEECGWGSSADVQIAGAAGDLCANVFRGKLSAEDKKMYLALIHKCKKKYEKMSGTLYISGEAYCELGVGKLFASLYSPVED